MQPWPTFSRPYAGEPRIDTNERGDTRVLQIIFELDRPAAPVYVGQQVDVFIERPGTPALAKDGARATQFGQKLQTGEAFLIEESGAKCSSRLKAVLSSSSSWWIQHKPESVAQLLVLCRLEHFARKVVALA